MFERFTDEARQVVVKAQGAARDLRHAHIGAEHLLLGALASEDGMGARLLEDVGVTWEAVRGRLSPGDGEAPTGQIPFTPEAKKGLELALREALTVSTNYIGSEHIVLAVTRLEDGLAARILHELGVDRNRMEESFVKLVPTRSVLKLESARRQRWRPGMSGLHNVAPCWEYRIERRPELGEEDAEWLNTLGAEGWELCAVVPSADRGTLVFRRQKPIGFRATGT